MFFNLGSLALVPIFNKPWRNFSSASLKQRNRNNSTGSISTSTFPLCPTWTFWGVEAFEPGCKPKALTPYPGPKASRTTSRCWVSLQKGFTTCPICSGTTTTFSEPWGTATTFSEPWGTSPILCKTFHKPRNPLCWSPEAWFHEHQNPSPWGPVTHFHNHQNPTHFWQHQNPSHWSPVTPFGQHQNPSHVTSRPRPWASTATCFLGSIPPDSELDPFPLPVPSLGLCSFTIPCTVRWLT